MGRSRPSGVQHLPMGRAPGDISLFWSRPSDSRSDDERIYNYIISRCDKFKEPFEAIMQRLQSLRFGCNGSWPSPDINGKSSL